MLCATRCNNCEYRVFKCLCAMRISAAGMILGSFILEGGDGTNNEYIFEYSTKNKS